jgi:hypothetical protein
MTDHSCMKLGKRPRRHDPRTLKMARYLTSSLPAAPPAVDYTQGIEDWGMMLNDKLGCCTIAALGHALQTWTAASNQELTVPDSTILDYYRKWDGYDPANPGSDQGGVELEILNDWRQQEFAGRTLDAFVAIEPGTANTERGVPDSAYAAGRLRQKTLNIATCDSASSAAAISNSGLALAEAECSSPTPAKALPDIATAIWLFGGAYVGVELPVRAQGQEVWDVPKNTGSDDEPGSWGGHAIYLVGYDFSPSSGAQHPTFTCVTWGRTKRMTWAWVQKYCSEAYALVSKDWLGSTGVAPCGFDLATLESDLSLVTA